MFEIMRINCIIISSGQPAAKLVGNSDHVEENQHLRLKCLGSSTTVPKNHNLTLKYSWELDVMEINDSSSRVMSRDNELLIASLSREDNFSVTCQVTEENGLFNTVSTVPNVNCKSDIASHETK